MAQSCLTLWTHGLQHVRIPCPSPTTGVYSNSCPSTWWMPSNHLILCHPLNLHPSIVPSIRVFSNESALCIRWPKYGVSASASVLPMNNQDWFPIWTIKKAEHWKLDAFELWCGRRLLRVPWTTRRSNQSMLKEISPGCSLEELILKLKLHYFGHLMQRANSFEKTLMLRKIEGRRRRGWQRMRWLDGIIDSMDMSLSKL